MVHESESQVEPVWVQWARKLAALAQSGLTYSENHFDIDRYEQMRKLAGEISAYCGDIEHGLAVEFFEAEKGYATPKVDVRGAAFRDDKILMVREVADGGWTLPGGWADVNDSPSEAIEREIFEESGFTAKAVKLAAVWDRRKHAHLPASPVHIYKVFFICEITGGRASCSSETDGVDFFAVDDLPKLSVSRILPGQIKRMFEHNNDRTLPADFD